MMDSSKYHIGYFPVDKKYNKWVERDHIEKASRVVQRRYARRQSEPCHSDEP